MLEEQQWYSTGFYTRPQPSVVREMEIQTLFSDKTHTDPLPSSFCIVSEADASGDQHALFPTASSTWISPDHQISKVLVDSFAEVTEVASICAEFRRDRISIWTILASYDRSARRKVHEKELDIALKFRLRDFAFRVTSKTLVAPEELKKTGFVELFRRD